MQRNRKITLRALLAPTLILAHRPINHLEKKIPPPTAANRSLFFLFPINVYAIN